MCLQGIEVNISTAFWKAETCQVATKLARPCTKYYTERHFSGPTLAASPRVRRMVGHVLLAKPTLLTICYCSHHHCHTQVMVAAVIGDVVIHLLL